MNDINNNFSNNLKHLRNQKGLTQLQLAKLMKKDYSTIGKWENGTRSPIVLDVIKISEIFDVTLEDLIFSDIIGNNKDKDELEILLHNNINKLTDDDKDTIRFILEKRNKESS